MKKVKRVKRKPETNMDFEKWQEQFDALLDEFAEIRTTHKARMGIYASIPRKAQKEKTYQKMDDIMDYWENQEVIMDIGQAFWNIIPELRRSVHGDLIQLKEKLIEWREKTAQKYSYSTDLITAIVNRYLKLYATQEGEDIHFFPYGYEFDRERYENDNQYRKAFQDLIELDYDDQMREMYGLMWADLARIMFAGRVEEFVWNRKIVAELRENEYEIIRLRKQERAEAKNQKEV